MTRGKSARVVAAAVALLAVGWTTGAVASPALTVRITSAPPSASASASATFGWVANETAEFSCSLDGARAAACSSPKTYSGLGEGLHVFLVTATNKDRAGNTYTARDTHRWTIDLPGGPPPPPPPSETANLLVTVEGGGEVSSEPAGIDCPGDCEQSFPVGTKVTLTPKAGAGARFAGWHGACDGAGACAPALSATTLVLAAFTALGPQPHLYRGDREGDGLSSAKDACPNSPRGLKPLLAGCTAIDLLNGADELVADVDDALDLARQKTLGRQRTEGRRPRPERGHGPDRAGCERRLRRRPLWRRCDDRQGRAALGPGQGAACRDAEATRQAAASGRGMLATQTRRICNSPASTIVKGCSNRLRARSAKLQRAYAAICGDLGEKVTLVGRVGKTKDADGLIELRAGQLISLAGADYDPDDIWEGGRVKAVTHKIGSGPWVAQSVVALDKDLGTVHLTPCVSLRIAPVQEFDKPNPILHSPKGYLFSDVLRLEAGMRFAASPKCANGKSGRYSLTIVMSSSNDAFTVAADLDSNDPPVPIPVGGGATLWQIRVYERYQGSNCPPPSSSQSSYHDARTTTAAAKNFPCPVQHISTTKFKARVLDRGVYGRAGYEKTIFPLESSAPQTTKVESIYPLHYTIQPSKATFEGDGYKPGGSPGPLVTVKLNETFALWPDTYYGAPLLFMLDTIGVDHFAGLLWPRIVGTRNGAPFRYTAELPTLVKDLIPDCPSVVCFYRLPWKYATFVGTAQGNGPGFSHNGKQLYAWDFSMSDGATIYATRGGLVGDLVESNSKNFNPCADNNGNGVKGDEEDKKADGPTNYVRVDHDDGTYSYYAHVRLNSVIPAKNSIVQRGDPIASVGNVGRSCGPHLHYQVATDNTNTIYGQTTSICFEGWRWIQPVTFDFFHCYKPVTSDVMFSTNG